MKACVAKALVAAFGVGVFCCSAQADLSPIGAPFPTGSWSQAWKYDGGAMDAFAVEVLSGTPFESMPLLGFSDGSWAITSEVGDTYVDAAGDASSM